MNANKTTVLFLICLFVPYFGFSQLKLPQFFKDGMVLQRNKAVKIWGWANPKTTLKLTFNDQTHETEVDNDGQWMVSLPSMKASDKPQTISITNTDTQLDIKNVLIGDVWICSGQSNMDWSIKSFPYAEKEQEEAKFQGIRVFKVEKDLAASPKEDLPGGKWLSAEGDNVLHFSAVAYFYGKYLHKELNVPIGLIVSAWGGTNVEAWTPPTNWTAFPEIEQVFLQKQKDLNSLSLEDKQKAFAKIISQNVLTGIGLEENWQKPEGNYEDWAPIIIPQEKGNSIFKNMDGAVWMRKRFEIPLPFRGRNLRFNLGQMNDHDIVWINGHKVGESNSKLDWRNYIVKKELIQEGFNEIVVRVFDYDGDGGYVTDPYFINFHPVGDRQGYHLLSGDWKYKVGKKLQQPLKIPKLPTNKGALANTSPSSLYNQMIHPLRKLAISGAIWYQGESNSTRGYEYKSIFPAMIKGWRAAFQQGDFPFLFVQLTNYHGKSRDGQFSNWPELRQAQAEALELPKTGMAVILDIGESKNIHPKNKQDVGKRLALAALNIHYKQKTPYQGPSILNLKRKKEALIVSFDHTCEGLKPGLEETYNDLSINHFELAGEDGVFHPAQARIINSNQLKVWSKDVSIPKHLKYAWKNDPVNANLYNSCGLPAAPFRTDIWEWETKGNKYIHLVK
ncbi:MAG: sialate O-acetylesterase [Bacteroidota bacterium]